MSDPILQRVWKANAIRLVGDGVPAGDVAAAQARLDRWDAWYPFWASRGDAYEALGRAALAKGRRQSAGELLWQACLSYHYAQFLWFHDPKNRDAGQHKKVALYREAAPLFSIPAERFDLTVDGIPVLIDPGTFTYTTSRAWRDYFRSTAAHNTVSLGDESSSTPAGPFSWRSTATSSLERWHASDVVDYFAGTHDGYERAGIDAGVCRQLLFIKSGYWIVRDTVRSEHDVGASASFQAAAGLTIRQDGLRSLAVACGHDVLRIDVLDEGSAISIENAWVSHAYGAKSEAPRLCVRFGAAAGGELHTVLSAARLAARVRRTRTMERDIIEVLHGEVVDRVVFAESEGRAPIDGVETDADIVFLRRTNETDEPREVFVSGATRLIVDDVTIATSPVPSAFAAAYDPDSGSWRRRDVGVIASVVEHGVSSGKIEREAPASDRVPTPSVEVPYYSG